MGLFTRKSKQQAQNIDTFGEEGREMSAQMRRMRAEKNRLLAEMELMEIRKEYQDLKSELQSSNSDEDGGLFGGNNATESLITAILTGALSGKVGQNQAGGLNHSNTPPPQTASPILSDLSPEQINEIIEQIPRKYLKMSRGFGDDTIKNLILKNFPAATPNDLNNILEEIRRRA